MWGDGTDMLSLAPERMEGTRSSNNEALPETSPDGGPSTVRTSGALRVGDKETGHWVRLNSPGAESCPSPGLGGSSPSDLEASGSPQVRENFNLALWTAGAGGSDRGLENWVGTQVLADQEELFPTLGRYRKWICIPSSLPLIPPHLPVRKCW